MILWLLIVSHALIDFPLQGDFLAKGKNHKAPLPGVPWYACLAAHALIAGGAVSLVTGRLDLGVVEALLHARIDYLKNDGGLGEGATAFNIDQAFHVLCKVAWWAVVSIP